MYTRSVPPSGASLETLVDWLLIELAAIESELAIVTEELEALKEA